MIYLSIPLILSTPQKPWWMQGISTSLGPFEIQGCLILGRWDLSTPWRIVFRCFQHAPMVELRKLAMVYDCMILYDWVYHKFENLAHCMITVHFCRIVNPQLFWSLWTQLCIPTLICIPHQRKIRGPLQTSHPYCNLPIQIGHKEPATIRWNFSNGLQGDRRRHQRYPIH